MLKANDLLWKTKILIAKTAGLRRGEILNLTVNDIDFAKSKIIVQPKSESDYTWRWVVKDKERRELPLVESVAQLLANIQADLPEMQPYLLLTPERYKHMMKLKNSGNPLSASADIVLLSPISSLLLSDFCLEAKIGATGLEPATS